MPDREADQGQNEAPKTSSPELTVESYSSRFTKHKEAWERLSTPAAVRFLGKALLRHPWALAGSITAGLLIVVSSFLSIGLIIPFIHTLAPNAGGGGLIEGTKIGFLIPYFEQFSVVDRIRIIAVAFIGIQLFQGTISYVAGRIAEYMEVMVERDLKAQAFEQALAVDYHFLQQDRTANLYTIMKNYTKTTAKQATKFLKAIPKVSKLAAYVAAMVALSWKLSILSLVFVTMVAYMLNFMIRRLKKMSWDINEARVLHNHVTLEALNAMKVVRLFAREDHTRGQFRDTLKDLQDQKYRAGSVDALTQPLAMTLNMGLFAGLIIAATFVIDQSAADWVVLLMAFIFITSQVMRPASSLIKRRSAFHRSLPSVQMLMEWLDRSDKPYMPQGSEAFQRLARGVQFEEVRFRYGEDLDEVIQGISFAIPKGDTIALVGASGAGKSTTINLLARLYDPTAGRILVDGQDLRSFDGRSWRKRLAVVSQSTYLFNVSARENIRYGRLDATDTEVEEAAKLANAHEFIMAMEEGYETQLGERGARISGGQAQRIAIARAILADPDILILDEATSSLDTETERLVQQAIERVSKDRTVVAIAHRLSTIRNADNILVLEEGRIVEQGTHEGLIAGQGRYWEYVQLQRLLIDDEGDGPPAKDEKPTRIILRPGEGPAHVMAGDRLIAEAEILLINNGGHPEERLQDVDRDAVLLAAGSDRATCRVGGRVVHGVPLFLADGGSPNGVRPAKVRRVEPRRSA